MSNVLTITVSVPSAYPTVNTMWASSARRGKKTPQYHELFDAIFDAATEEIGRTGWVCAEYLVDTTLTLYHRVGIFPDASNLGKVELDALTKAGVWTDDKLADPVTFTREYDPSQEAGSLTVVLRRRFPPYVAHPPRLVAKVLKKRNAVARGVEAAPAVPARQPVGKTILVDGVPQPYDETMAEIRNRYFNSGSDKKGKRR